MKKTYIKPSTTEVKVMTPTLMEGSPQPKFSPNEPTTVMESRRHSYNVWGDEESEEE
jgi:hypothetical protein